MADSDSLDIFISYGREPEIIHFVKQLKRDLEGNGFSVWLDQENIPSGSDWHGAIGTGLHNCKVLIPVVTKKYITSRYCVNELYTADGDRKIIYPIMYEDVDFESTETGRGVKFVVSSINWTMFRPSDDYAASLTKLVHGLKKKLASLPEVSLPEVEDAKDEDEVVITVGPSSGTPIHVIPDIESPQQVAIGRNGEIAVSCFQGHKVLVYDCKFEPVTEIGCQGFIDGQFLCPSGVAIDSENQIVVSSYHKLQRFTIDGKFVDAVGEHGKGELQFDCPTNIAIGQEGRLYVSESNNKRVQILNDDLSFHGTFSKACSKLGSGRLNQPQGSAVNSEGKVYVADMMNHAIQVFSPEGEFLFKFGKYGIPNTPGITCTPMAIAIDPLDYVYVGGSGGGISIFDKEGDFVRSFGSYGSEHGQFNMIKGMHIDRCGNLYVCEWSVNRVQIFPGPQSLRHRGDATQQPIDSSEVRAKPKSRKPAYAIGPKSKMPIKVLPDISQPLKMVAGTQGEIVLAVFGDRKVMILDKNFEVIREFNRENEKQGRFVYPAGIAVDESNSILLSTSHYLHRFTMSGDLLASIDGGKGQHGDNVLELDHPQGIAVGKNGRIYVADKRCKRVHIINDDFSLFGFAQNPELTKKSKDSPEDVAISSEGRVYVIDSGIYCVLVFAPDGEFLFKFGKQGAPNIRGALTSPHAITLDDEDNVYIGDAVGIIHIFDKNGGFIRQFGGNGEEPGQFSFISGLHFDKNTHLLYVCEWSNDRVQIFECQ